MDVSAVLFITAMGVLTGVFILGSGPPKALNSLGVHFQL
jgi:hypothetical protein